MAWDSPWGRLPVATQDDARPEPVAPRPARSWLWPVVAFVSAAAAVGSLLLAASTGDQLGALKARVHAVEQQQELAATGQRDLRHVDDTLSARVGRVEQKVLAVPDTTVIAHELTASVYTVRAGDFIGSAFVAQVRDGTSYLVTNFHVVASLYATGARTVRLEQGSRHFTGRIGEVSSGHDLAAIAVAARLTPLPIADGAPQVGEPVVVAGSPLDMEGTVTTGVVSAFRTEHGVQYMQFSAPVSPGSSGGPVVDRTGHVVGVTAAKVVGTGAEGLGFAIPIRVACGALGVC